MKFEVETDKLIDFSVTLNQYFLCQMIYQQDGRSLNYYLEQFGHFVNKGDFDKLIEKEYITMHDIKRGYIFSNFSIGSKFVKDFVSKEVKVKLSKDCIEDWIDLWYNLFPKGVKGGNGIAVRSGKDNCITKMKKFVKANPTFTKEIILKATNNYIEHMRSKNYAYVSLASYFIYKDGMSILAGQCEAIVDAIKAGKNIDLSLDQYKTGEVVEEASDLFSSSSMMDRI